jgi:hypothetical protein
MLSGTGDPELGIDALREQVTIRRRLDDPIRLAAALNNLGNLLYDIGEIDAAEVALREAIDAQREGGEPPTLMLCSLARAKCMPGAPAPRNTSAKRSPRHGRRSPVRHRPRHGRPRPAPGAGRRTDEARPLLVEARERFEELNVSPGVADVDLSLAVLHRATAIVAAQRAACCSRSPPRARRGTTSRPCGQPSTPPR